MNTINCFINKLLCYFNPDQFALDANNQIVLKSAPQAVTNDLTLNPATGELTSTVNGVVSGPIDLCPAVVLCETDNISSSNTILTTGTSGHTLDVNAPLKTVACGGDVTPADAEAEYNPVHRAADGTLWTKVDAKSSAGYDQTSAGSCPNIPIAAGTAGGIGIDGNYGNGIGLSYTNNTCYDVKLRVGFTFSSNILINAGSLITSGIEMSINGGAFSLTATHEGQISAGQYRLNSPQYRETFFTVSPSTTITITTRQKVYDNTSNNNSTMSCWSNELRFDWTTM